MPKLEKILSLLAACSIVTWFAVTPALAQMTVADFYRGKNVNLIVGMPVGGGTDNYARLVAKYISRYIPGNPSIVVQNMPGATSGRLADYLTKQANKDGSVIATVDSSLIVAPLLTSRALSYDPSRFEYLGSANSDNYMCIVRGDAPVKSFHDALSQTVIMGAGAPGSSSKSYNFPVFLKNVIGAKFQIVGGYPGSPGISLAIETGEVQGMCGLSWSTLAAQHPTWLERGTVRVLVQEGLEGHPDLNKKGIPLTVDFARTEEQRRVMELFYSQNVFGRPFLAPEGTPSDRLEALRVAFLSALRDQQLLEDAARARMDVSAISGGELQPLIAKVYALPQAIRELAREAISKR